VLVSDSDINADIMSGTITLTDQHGHTAFLHHAVDRRNGDARRSVGAGRAQPARIFAIARLAIIGGDARDG
jgi:hypothetical protein